MAADRQVRQFPGPWPSTQGTHARRAAPQSVRHVYQEPWLEQDSAKDRARCELSNVIIQMLPNGLSHGIDILHDATRHFRIGDLEPESFV
jgi:hypothetical protein